MRRGYSLLKFKVEVQLSGQKLSYYFSITSCILLRFFIDEVEKKLATHKTSRVTYSSSNEDAIFSILTMKNQKILPFRLFYLKNTC